MHPDLGGPPAVLYKMKYKISSLQLMDAGSEDILIYEELRLEYPEEMYSGREILPSHLCGCLPAAVHIGSA